MVAWRSTGAEREQQRARLDAAGGGQARLASLTVLPYLAAYVVLLLVLDGSFDLGNGLFAVVFAVILLTSSIGPGSRWRPAGVVRIAAVSGAVVAGAVMALLVDRGLG